MVPPSVLWTDGAVTGTKGLVPGLTGKYYRDCRKTEKLAWLNLDERVPILTQKERGIDHPVGRNQKWCVDRDEDKDVYLCACAVSLTAIYSTVDEPIDALLSLLAHSHSLLFYSSLSYSYSSH